MSQQWLGGPASPEGEGRGGEGGGEEGEEGEGRVCTKWMVLVETQYQLNIERMQTMCV